MTSQAAGDGSGGGDGRGARRVVVAGGGVAGLEAALALHHLAPDLADVTLVAPEPEFTMKPLAVNEPFALEPPERHELGPAMEQLGFGFVLDGVVAVHPDTHEVGLASGDRLPYDFLICAIGGRARPAYERAETFWASRSDLAINELLDRAADAPGRTLTFIVPPGCSWPLPLYEVALMARTRADERGPYGVGLRIVTPEAAPLGVFGEPASHAVADLRIGIEVPDSRFADFTAAGGPQLQRDRVQRVGRLEHRSVAPTHPLGALDARCVLPAGGRAKAHRAGGGGSRIGQLGQHGAAARIHEAKRPRLAFHHRAQRSRIHRALARHSRRGEPKHGEGNRRHSAGETTARPRSHARQARRPSARRRRLRPPTGQLGRRGQRPGCGDRVLRLGAALAAAQHPQGEDDPTAKRGESAVCLPRLPDKQHRSPVDRLVPTLVEHMNQHRQRD